MTKFSRKVMRVVAIIYAIVLIVVSVLPSGRGTLGGWDKDIAPSLQNALHVPVYALLVAMVTFAIPLRHSSSHGRILIVVLSCCIFGAILESVQVLVRGRSASVTDGLLNVTGVLAGAAVVIGWRRLFRHTKLAIAERSAK